MLIPISFTRYQVALPLMIKSGHIVLSVLILIVSLSACNEDYVQPENVLPFIKVKFIDTDSAASINADIAAIEAEITTIDARIKEIDAAENKADLLDEKDSLNDVKDELNKDKNELKTSLSDVNKGLATITSFNGQEPLVASKSQHELDLNPNDTISTFEVLIYNELYSFSLDYELEYVYTENELRAIATAAKIFDHNFTTAEASCTNCRTNDAILTLYF